MLKKPTKTKKRNLIRAARVEKTANVIGVSPSLVQKVLRGDRSNETVVKVFMEITERENVLIEEVKKLIPFN